MLPIALPPAAVVMLEDPRPTPTGDRPIQLAVNHDADRLDIAVIASRAAPDATFELEITSEGIGGSTTTVQSGTARGKPAGQPLISSRIQTSGLAGWRARLHVVIGTHEYVVIEKS